MSGLPSRAQQAGASAVKASRDLAYGKHTLQKLDFYFNETGNNETPVLVLIHGGGWTRGDKRELSPFLDIFQKKGFHIANINYRLAGRSGDQVIWSDMIADVNAALHYIKDHAKEWGIRSNKYVLWGASSGAHLSLLYAYQFNDSGLVSAVAGFGTPTKLNDVSWNAEPYQSAAMPAMPALTGQIFNADTSNPILKTVSPYYSTRFVPTLLIHGDKDNSVPYTQSVLLYELLQQRKVESKLIILQGGGHWGQGAAFTSIQAAVGACADWISKYGK